MFDSRDHILDLRGIPVMRGKSPGQFPYPLDRIEVGAVRRQIFEPEPRFRHFPPLLVQRGMMVSCVVRDHHDLPAGTRTDLKQMPQEVKARLGIEASRLTPVNQLAVAAAGRRRSSRRSSVWGDAKAPGLWSPAESTSGIANRAAESGPHPSTRDQRLRFLPDGGVFFTRS